MEIDVYLFVGIFFVVQDVQSFNAWRWRKHERWSYLGDTSCKFLILVDLTSDYLRHILSTDLNCIPLFSKKNYRIWAPLNQETLSHAI